VRRGGVASNLQATLPFELTSAVVTADEVSCSAQPEIRNQARDQSLRGQTLSEALSETVNESLNDSRHIIPESDRRSHPPARPAARNQRSERFEIAIPKQQPATRRAGMDRPAASQLNFALNARSTTGLNAAPKAGESPDTLFPVASLTDRRRAALLDVALLLFSYGGMLALFAALGGRIGFNKLDAVVTTATLALFYAQYFALFTIFGGSTPGMMVRGLRAVSFDGSIPTSRQMAWRSLGYLISAGTCFLGFVWALWDEDHLCWHDRISLTYLTPIEGFALSKNANRSPN
jgi:uncharacterized RDD family membrane protein YckC